MKGRLKSELWCKWTEDESGVWTTRCDRAWTFIDDGVAENGVTFCCFCGKRIDPIVYEEPPVPDDEPREAFSSEG